MRNYKILSLILIMVLSLSGCGSGATSGDPLGTDTISVNLSVTSLGSGESSVITATVKHANGSASIGRSVSFSFVANNSAGTLTVTNDGANTGVATATYTAGASTPASSVQDTVLASISNGAAAAVVITRAAITGGGGAGGRQISFSGSPTSLAAGQNSILTATVTDNSGNIVSGQTIAFSFISNLSGAPALTVLNLGLTDASGRAVAVYTAGTATPNTEVQDAVKAEIVGIAATPLILTRTSATAVPPVVYLLNLAADVASLAAGQIAIVTATVTDGSGNPASGQTVTFAILNNNSGATLATLNAGKTDSSGTAVAVYTAGATTPASSVQDTIQASVTGSIDAIAMTRTAAGGGVGSGVRMTVTATPTSLIAGAASVIVAQVNNADGTVASGMAVTFGFVTNNSGAPALTTVNATTDASGTATATYTAGNNSPDLSIQDTVKANVTGSAGAAIITRLAATGTGNRISLTMTPATSAIAPLGSTTSNCIVTATVLRDDGVTPVANEMVTFSIVTGGGAIAPLTVTTNNSGVANGIFTAPGTATGNQAVVRAQILGTNNGGDAVGIVYW